MDKDHYTPGELGRELSFTEAQVRRLLDHLSTVGSMSFVRGANGERKVDARLLTTLQEVKAELGVSTVTQEYVRAVLNRYDAPPMPADGARDPWQVALNVAAMLGDTRARVLALWELVRATSHEHRLPVPDLVTAFYVEPNENAL